MKNVPILLKKYVLVVMAAAYIALGYAFYQLPDEKFHLYFLNVDQGDGILIKTPQSHYILVDGGPMNFVLQELGEVLPFFEREIDFMVLTHPHSDHIEGLIEVLKRYKVNNVLLTGVNVFDNEYKEFLKEIRVQNIRIFIAESKTDFVFGEVKMDIIYPFKEIIGQNFANINDSSVGMRISYKDKNIVLLGDLEAVVEKELVKTDLSYNVDIYKASHHGSKTSSSLEFLKRLRPKTVVIQVGENNKFKHPSPETLNSFKELGITKILRTDMDGRIEFAF
jgi:competence protein ComEC